LPLFLRITSLINSGILAPKNSRLDFILRPKVRDFPAICYIRFQNLQAASSPQLQNPHIQKITPFRGRQACLRKLPLQDGKPPPRVTPPLPRPENSSRKHCRSPIAGGKIELCTKSQGEQKLHKCRAPDLEKVAPNSARLEFWQIPTAPFQKGDFCFCNFSKTRANFCKELQALNYSMYTHQKSLQSEVAIPPHGNSLRVDHPPPSLQIHYREKPAECLADRESRKPKSNYA